MGKVAVRVFVNSRLRLQLYDIKGDEVCLVSTVLTIFTFTACERELRLLRVCARYYMSTQSTNTDSGKTNTVQMSKQTERSQLPLGFVSIIFTLHQTLRVVVTFVSVYIPNQTTTIICLVFLVIFLLYHLRANSFLSLSISFSLSRPLFHTLLLSLSPLVQNT